MNSDIQDRWRIRPLTVLATVVFVAQALALPVAGPISAQAAPDPSPSVNTCPETDSC